MKKKRFSEEQIVGILREADRGEKTIEALCREHGINTIVYEYAKIVERKNLVPLAARMEVQGSKRVIIKA